MKAKTVPESLPHHLMVDDLLGLKVTAGGKVIDLVATESPSEGLVAKFQPPGDERTLSPEAQSVSFVSFHQGPDDLAILTGLECHGLK